MKKLATLFALYFAQGLPFGFQVGALPLLLRERGASLEAIGFAGALSAPWLTKAAWAPFVDRYGSRRFGRRKSWIVPMQAALAAGALFAAHTHDLTLLAALILVMNLCAATQDIAVDGLAVSTLQPSELGVANAIQVVGYKFGMLMSSGLLLSMTGVIGWRGLFYAMAALMVLVLVISLGIREVEGEGAPETSRGARETISFAGILARLREAARQPGAGALIAVILTYKMGESLADAMWKPLLFDRGFTSAQIGLWSGTYGMFFSIAGTIASGLLVRKLALGHALLWISALRALGIGAQLWLSVQVAPAAAAVIAVTCVEHLFGGAITTVLFALMMRAADREIGGTHYTLLASLEVWGKMPLSTLSGVIAANGGYPALFGIATALCVAFTVLVLALRGNFLRSGNSPATSSA